MTRLITQQHKEIDGLRMRYGWDIMERKEVRRVRMILNHS